MFYSDFLLLDVPSCPFL